MFVIDIKNLPHIQSYGSIQALSQNINKSERQHDLVIAVSIILTLNILFGFSRSQDCIWFCNQKSIIEKKFQKDFKHFRK